METQCGYVKTLVFRLLLVLLVVGSLLPILGSGKAAGDDEHIIIDHSCTDITAIPQSAIEDAKATLHIGYGHTSHGNQLLRGMTPLVDFANGGGLGLALPTNIFAWNNGGTGGALDLEDSYSGTTWFRDGDGELLTCAFYPDWVQATRDYLDDPEHSDVNVIMWSWCRDVDTQYLKEGETTLLNEYLLPMSQLEADYPNVQFVYMTGTLGIPEFDAYDDVIAANQIIRDYCIANGKILYDFADIENWDPDGNYYEVANENCDYFAPEDTSREIILGNWATEWQTSPSHPVNVDWYICNPQHTQPLNGNLKAYTAWWLFARLAGWDGSAPPPPDTEPPAVTVHSPDGGESFKAGCQYDITWTATDDVGVTSITISYSTDNGVSYTDIDTGQDNDGSYTWTVPDAPSAICLVKVSAGDAAGNWGHGESGAVFEIFGPIPGDADNDCDVDEDDITKTERIILEIDTTTEDADANEDGDVNALDITKIEQITGL